MNIKVDFNKVKRSKKDLCELLNRLVHIIDSIVYNKGSLSFEESYRNVYDLILYHKGYVMLHQLLESYEYDICHSDYYSMKTKMNLIKDICLYPLNSIRRGEESRSEFEENGKSILEMWFYKMTDIENIKYKTHVSLNELNFPNEIKCIIERHVV